MKPLISMRKVVQAGSVVVDEKNPHIRNNRDSTVIQAGRGCVSMKLVRLSARTVSGTSVANKPPRPRKKCSSESEESCAEQEVTDEEGEGIRRRRRMGQEQQTGECEQAPRKTDCKRKGRTRSNTHAIPRLVAHTA